MNNCEARFGKQTRREQVDRGIALMVAIFALLILSLIGLGMLHRASTEILINENFKRSRSVFYTAEAGTEEARYRLSQAAETGNRIDTLFTDAGASNTVVYIRANISIDPTDQSSSNLYRDSEYATISTR